MLIKLKKKEDYELCKGDLVLANGKYTSFEEAEKELGKEFKGFLCIRNITTNEKRLINRVIENKRIVG